MAISVLFAVGRGSAMGLRSAFGLVLACTAAGSVLGSFATERLIKRLRPGLGTGDLAGHRGVVVGVPAVTASPALIGIGFFDRGGGRSPGTSSWCRCGSG